MTRTRRTAYSAIVLLFSAVVAIACDDDPTGVGAAAGTETAVVVNSVDISLSVFPVDSPTSVRTIGLAQAGSPVKLAVRGGRAVVPLGIFPAVAVADLAAGTVRTIPLPSNSGATDAAFADDSTVLVTNPNINSVSFVDLAAGVAGTEVAVPGFPQALIVTGGRAFVLRAELDSLFQPARPGRISVVDVATRAVVDSISLSGFNPTAAALGPDGQLLVLNAGSFGQGNGSLSVIDPTTLREVAHHTGFGDFPGDLAVGPDGRIFVSSFSFGIAIWDPTGSTFVRPPSDPLALDGVTSSSGVTFDGSGRLYSLVPGDCVTPSRVLRTTPDLSFESGIDVGSCPFAIGIASVVSDASQ